jgi:hypothetical protein
MKAIINDFNTEIFPTNEEVKPHSLQIVINPKGGGN